MSEKICIDCKVSKKLENFEPTRKICKDCHNVRRRKVQNKLCSICKQDKNVNEFKTTRAVSCLSCSQDPILSLKKRCNTCDELKEKTDFFGQDAQCKVCRRKKFVKCQSFLKICNDCGIELEIKYFRNTTTNTCLNCENKLFVQKICKDCDKEKNIVEFRPGRGSCIDCERARGRSYRRTTTKAKEWRDQNREKHDQLQKNWYESNKKYVREKEKERRLKSDLTIEIYNYRKRIPGFIRGKSKYSNSLGLCHENYIKWLSYNFEENMNMENYGKEWCIDHVIPLDILDKDCYSSCILELIQNIPNHKELIFSWCNTKPLTKSQNREKGCKIDKKHIDIHNLKLKNYMKQNPDLKSDIFSEYKKMVRAIIDLI